MADDDQEQIGQDEIEQLLAQAKAGAEPADAETKPDPPAEEDSGSLDQSEIEALLAGQSAAPTAPTSDAKSVESILEAAPPSPAPPPPQTTQASIPGADKEEPEMVTSDVEYLLNQAEQALASINNPIADAPPNVESFQLKDLTGAPASTEVATLDLVRDVQLDLRIELGRTHMYLEDVLKLRKGAVVPLDKLAGDPVDIFVNGRMVARGEVLVLNDNFCVRVAELIVGESAVA